MSHHQAAKTIRGREVAILAADGVNEKDLFLTQQTLEKEGVIVKIIAPTLSNIKGDKGSIIKVDHTFLPNMSMLFDALYVPGGAMSAKILIAEKNALEFICEVYKASKAIATDGEGVDVLRASCMKDWLSPSIYTNLLEQGIVIQTNPTEPAVKKFIKAIERNRFWDRLQLSTDDEGCNNSASL